MPIAGFLSIAFSLVSFLFPVAVIGAIVYFVVRRRNGGMGITGHHILLAYFWAVTAASVIIVSIGVGYLLYAGLSVAYNARTPTGADLALGLTLLITGGAIGALHVVGRRAVERKDEEASAILRRIYLFAMLALFSLVGLVALPSAVYGAIQYSLSRNAHASDPAGSLAMAAVTVPLWAYYLLRVLRDMRSGVAEKTGEQFQI